MITVNNYFFAHWIKEIDIKCYGDDLQILPTDNPTDIYRYFDKILKLLLRNVLKTFEITLLHSRKKPVLTGNCDRRPNNSDNASNRTDENLTDRVAKLANIINGENAYSIPLRFLCDIGLVNIPIKLDTKVVRSKKGIS